MNWFDVDRSGLAAILNRRGKAFVVYELLSNAWDAGATRVDITLDKHRDANGKPWSNNSAQLIVEDDSPEGWSELGHAYTLFARSSRGQAHDKRGRFNVGEKLVLAVCSEAKIITMNGTVLFNVDGREKSRAKRERGTRFEASLPMTTRDLAAVLDEISGIIPPAGVETYINGQLVTVAQRKEFSAKLPTEIAGEDGLLRRTTRQTTVEAIPAETGEVLELGIPICAIEAPWRLNVGQKVPVSIERDSVTDGFRKALQVAAVNALGNELSEDQANDAWVSEAIADARADKDAVAAVVTKRFGDRVVVATPGDPMANAKAEAMGYTVIHGGALPSGAWANVRKHELLHASAKVFPTPRATVAAGGAVPEYCPTCKQPL